MNSVLKQCRDCIHFLRHPNNVINGHNCSHPQVQVSDNKTCKSARLNEQLCGMKGKLFIENIIDGNPF